MGIFDNLRAGIQNHLDKKREEREHFERMQREIDFERKLAFETAFKDNALKVAFAQAKLEAEKKSGIQKLRATNRVRTLSEPNQSSGTFFDKLSQYTQRNLANREKNMARTNELRDTGKKMRTDKLAEQKRLRGERMGQAQQRKLQRKPFGGINKNARW